MPAAWIGLEPESSMPPPPPTSLWSWTDGTTVNFTNWQSPAPTSVGSTSTVAMMSDGTWDVISSTTTTVLLACCLRRSCNSQMHYVTNINGSDACVLLSTCVSNIEYQSVAPTGTSDRVCSNYTVTCVSGAEFEKSSRTTTSDRVCSSYSPPCDIATQYQERPPTSTSDRVCQGR